MPNRVLRDWTCSEKINSVSELSEMFFLRLIMKADDFGRFHGNSKILKAHLFPLREISFQKIENCINELAEIGVILPYEIEGKKYIHIYDFNQRTRLMMSKFPEPKLNENGTLDNSPSNDGQMTVNCLTNDGEKPNQTKPNQLEEETETEEEEETETKHELILSTKVESIDFKNLLEIYNKIFERKCTVVSSKTEKQFKARLKEGFTKKQIYQAMKNVREDKFHSDNNFTHATLEFFSRSDKLNKWANVVKLKETPKIEEHKIDLENFDPNEGRTFEQLENSDYWWNGKEWEEKEIMIKHNLPIKI